MICSICGKDFKGTVCDHHSIQSVLVSAEWRRQRDAALSKQVDLELKLKQAVADNAALGTRAEKAEILNQHRLEQIGDAIAQTEIVLRRAEAYEKAYRKEFQHSQHYLRLILSCLPKDFLSQQIGGITGEEAIEKIKQFLAQAQAERDTALQCIDNLKANLRELEEDKAALLQAIRFSFSAHADDAERDRAAKELFEISIAPHPGICGMEADEIKKAARAAMEGKS